MRDPRTQDGIAGQPDGVEIACLLQPPIDRGNCIGGVSAEEAHEVALGISSDHRVEDLLPTVGAVDVAIAQGAALQHAELVEQEVRVVASAVEMPVPGCAFLIAMGRADGAVHVQHDVLQPVAVVEAVNPRAIQIGQRCSDLGQGQRLGFEPPICEAEAACASTARPPTTWRMTGSSASRSASLTSS